MGERAQRCWGEAGRLFPICRRALPGPQFLLPRGPAKLAPQRARLLPPGSAGQFLLSCSPLTDLQLPRKPGPSGSLLLAVGELNPPTVTSRVGVPHTRAQRQDSLFFTCFVSF